MELSRFELVEEVFRNHRHVVYRGRRRRSEDFVLLQTTARSDLDPADHRRLEREFEHLSTTAISGLPRPLEVIKAADRVWFAFEDRRLRPLGQIIRRRRLELPAFFELALRLTAILGDIHRHDLIHGAVSPMSVLSGADDELQVLPVGMAPSSSPWMQMPAADDATYISPEQTGRINRMVDYRTDFYSLGVVLYELLTGTPPFRGQDALELIHAHIAKAPVSPAAVDANVPEALANVVMTLLAKTPEDRYASSRGIAYDLEQCASQWRAGRSVTAFTLRTADVSERLIFPGRLYGRERELQALRNGFDKTCGGSTALMLVAGYSGSGKTALIRELHAPVVRAGGRFVSGKFDQVVRDIPYGALIPAFRALVRQLLTESEERLSRSREQLALALGANCGVLAEVIPEIELILGPQVPPPPLDPTESQNRFRYVLQSFIGTLAGEGHPLVVFLDDLQWADAATLDLFFTLLTDVTIRHLFFIGAYRSNEVGGDHPVLRIIHRLEAAHARVHRLAIEPLAIPDLIAFLADTLRIPSAEVEAFAGLIAQKTGGNPFFVIQFLKTLEQEQLILFDPESARWQFNLNAIARAGMTDNVVDLITSAIRRLSPAGQSVLTLAACIGGQFQWNTLVMVSRLTAEGTAAGLAEALSSGLLQVSSMPLERETPERPVTYNFLHDRVQQAAYELIPPDQKQPCHLDVGRLLLAECRNEVSDDRIFEIFNHLSIGRSLITDRQERGTFARLALSAGRKAKSSTAYEAAANYLDAGLDVIDAGAWLNDADLRASLYMEAAECHYLSGRFETAERYFETLLATAKEPLPRAQVHALRIVLYENQSRWVQAVQSGRDGLAVFGMTFPEQPEQKAAAVDSELAAIRDALRDRPIASLIDLPAMTDPVVRMLMRILTVLWAPAYVTGDELLARLISATMVRLSLQHGNAEDSAYGYVTHAITVGPIRRDYASAYEWGRLALAVNDRFRDPRHRAKIHQQFHAHVNLWRRPFETCIPHAREATRSGIEAGDFTYAGYGAATECWPAWVVNRDLPRFVNEFTPHLALLDKLRIADFRQAHRLILNWALALQDRTSGKGSLSDGDFDEAAYVAAFESVPFFMSFYFAAKLHIAVLLEDYPAAVDAAFKAKSVTPPGTMWLVLVDFWGSLAMVGHYADASDADRAKFRVWLQNAEGSLSQLADHCPENYRCFALLVSGGIRSIEGERVNALQFYEDALAYARLTENLQQEALANELCARTWLDRGSEPLAYPFLAEARRCYAVWGAALKVSQLDRRYPALSTAGSSVHADLDSVLARTPGPNAPSTLDMSTVLKAAHAVAVEVELEGLLRKLMKIAIESAGADRGVFLQSSDQRLVVVAEAFANPEQVGLGSLVSMDAAALAHTVVRYVHRTGETVVIGEASSDDRFRADEYIASKGPRSVLCLPVGHQSRQGGILYLENNFTAEAFTPARTEVIRVLAAQTAISLENARLYENMKAEVARRKEAEMALREANSELESLKNRLQAENVYLQEEIRTAHNFNDIIGSSPALLEALRKVERVAPTDSTVLIVGETGSGKELIARAVHSRSRRKDRPLVKVNCGAIAPGLVESELFGHMKGAFTGAIDRRVGRFELADGGTIFLDEIGELPLEAQVKLLRVLQEQEFEAVGSSRTVRVNVRVIAATNRDLEEAVREGKFRMDLLYRLNVVPIEVPPLRERPTDIRLLVGFFLNGLARRLGKTLNGFSDGSMDRLLRYSWPGNIRELQNVVERAAILAQGPVLELDAVIGKVSDAAPAASPQAAVGDSLEDIQRSHIKSVLKATGGVVEGPRGAATILGLHPNTLRSRMKKLGIAAPSRHANG